MKRSTAIRHLVEMAEVATDRLRFRSTEIGWPLHEMWVAEALLEPAEEIDHGTVVLMIDLPPDELPWLTVHPTAEWIGEQLRLGKRPISWIYRPMTWPAWNVRNRQVTRFWSAEGGLDHAVIDALRSGAAPNLVEPDRGEVDAAVATGERTRCRSGISASVAGSKNRINVDVSSATVRAISPFGP